MIYEREVLMVEVHARIFVASQSGCTHAVLPGKSFVHACKQPCHQWAVGYRGNLAASHPNYLVVERGDHLYLNMVDPLKPLFMPESFGAFRDFARRQYGMGRELVIHCNLGESRAPSLALLFMAKDLKAINGGTYAEASEAFRQVYPSYRPGRGIATFLNRNWHTL